MIELFRYKEIRKSLIAQHDIIVNRNYRVSFPRQYLMSLDQLENREIVRMTSVIDPDSHTRPSPMTVTLERVIDILKRLPDSRILAFKHSRDALEIYETIQGYLNNWIEIILEAPEFSYPTIQELYDLESVAKWAFPVYQHEKRMMSFRENRDFSKQQFAHPLLSLIGVLKSDDDVPSFISFLDNRLPQHLKAYRNEELFTEDLKEVLSFDNSLFGIKGGL